MHLKYLNSCPVCGSDFLRCVVDLGEMYSQGAFLTKEVTYAPKRKFPNILYRCDPQRNPNGCGAVFSKVIVPPEILYANYHYHSNTSKTMRDWLQKLVGETIDIVGDETGNKVLDIGANDLTTLKNFPFHWNKIGIDPSDIARKAALENPEVKVISGLFPDDCKEERNSFDAIFSIACYYDALDPVGFAENIVRLLKYNGIWVFEVAYLPTMMKDLIYSQIVPEHVQHYTFTVLEYIMEQVGLKVFRTEKTDTNAGSLLCFATHKSNNKYDKDEWRRNIINLRREEFDLELDTEKPYQKFDEEINNHLKKFREIVFGLYKQGKIIAVYGTSTKINTLIQASKTEEYFRYGIERSQEKVGGQTLWGLPIISEEEARQRATENTVWLLGPYFFKDEILKREQETRNKGVKFIIPDREISII